MCLYLFIYLLTFIYLFIFIYSSVFIYLFTYLLTYLLTCSNTTQVWWCMPLLPTLGRQRQKKQNKTKQNNNNNNNNNIKQSLGLNEVSKAQDLMNLYELPLQSLPEA